jgi:hypothetical protein
MAGITAVLWLIENGHQPGGVAPAAFRKSVNDETAKYEKIIQTIGLENN